MGVIEASDARLIERGWNLWPAGGECFIVVGDDRVRASAFIDDHAEGIPEAGQSVFVSLDRDDAELVAHKTVLWGNFLLLTAVQWRDALLETKGIQ